MYQRTLPKNIKKTKIDGVTIGKKHLEVEDIELQDRIDKLEKKIKDSFLIFSIQYEGVDSYGNKYYSYLVGESFFISSIKLTFKISDWNSIMLEMIEGLESIIDEVNGHTINTFAKMMTDISNIGKFAFSKLS